jgi:hypothetical protein
MLEDILSLVGLIGSIVGILAGVTTLQNWLRKRFGTPVPPETRPRKAILKDPITYWILAINLLVTALLPFQLYREFPIGPADFAGYAPYTFYFRHYPHITIFPVLLFGIAVVFIFRALYVWGEYAIAKANWRIGVAAALAFLISFWETSGRQMMLFEFNKEAQSATEPFNREETIRKAKSVDLHNAVDPASPFGRQVMAAVNNGLTPPPAATQRMDELLNHYDAWNELGQKWRSFSRVVYIMLFSYMTFIMVLGFALSIFLPRTNEKKSVQEARNAKLSMNLLGAFFVFLLWIPFRIFYNVNTKIPVFGPDNIWDNFFGKLPLTSRWGFTPADIVPITATVVWALILVVRIRRISRKGTVLLFATGGSLLAVGMGVLARLNRDAFLEVIGVGLDLKYIVFRILFVTGVTLLIYQLVESIPPKSSKE